MGPHLGQQRARNGAGRPTYKGDTVPGTEFKCNQRHEDVATSPSGARNAQNDGVL